MRISDCNGWDTNCHCFPRDSDRVWGMASMLGVSQLELPLLISSIAHSVPAHLVFISHEPRQF